MSLDLAGEHAPSLPETASLGASTGRRRSTPRAHVVAVVVARDGAARLPRVLAALAAASRAPDAVVGVDLGSRDASAALLRAAMPVLALPRRATPADAVEAVLAVRGAHGLTHGLTQGLPHSPARDVPTPDVAEWIWLLPQDAAPAPDALEQLLLAVETAPSVGVAGCKQVAWDDDQRLLDVGFTASPLGLRVTGLDRGEVDQGQHDGRSDVLAVSGAGMLVRRDVWEELRGLDPDLAPAAGDLDLCRRAHLAGHRVVVVPAAVVARATPRPGRRDARRAALHLRLASAPLPLLPVAALGVLLTGVAHALALLAVGRGRAARDEASATVRALSRPLAWRRTRRRQLRARRVPARVLRALRPTPDLLWRQRYDAVRSWLAVPPGPPGGAGALKDRLRGIGAPLLVAAAAGVVLTRDLVLGRSVPSGGGLLPAPSTSGALWAAATSSWRDVGLGARAAGDPYGALLALLGVPLGGDPGRAATVILVGALPFAAASAWAAASTLTRSRTVRTWAALAWAAAPPLLAAVAAGRAPAVLVHALLPLAALALARAAGLAPARRPLAWACRLGLLLVAVLAAAPSLVAPVAAVLAGALVVGRRRAVAPLALAAAVPAVLLLPWWAAVVRAPRLLLADPGLAASATGPSPGALDWPRLLGVPVPVDLVALGGSGPAVVGLVVAGLVVVPVLAVAVLGPLRRRAGGLAALGWWAAGCGVAVATVAGATAVAAAGAAPLAGVPGPGLSLALAGLGTSAVLAADVLPRRARRSRRPRLARAALRAGAGVALTTAVATAGVAASAGADLAPEQPPALPAVARADATSAAATRTLVLRVDRADRAPAVRWSLVSGDGPTLGDASAALAERGLHPAPPLARDASLVQPVIGRLLSGSGRDDRGDLADLGVGSVVLLPRADPAATLALDAAPGLDRFGDARGALLWRVQPPVRTARVRVIGPDGAVVATLPWRATGGVDADVPRGSAGRLLVLAERFDAGLHARVDGLPLTPRRWHGWAQAFVLPAAGGHLELARDEGRARLADPARAGVLAVALLVALPLPRVRGGGATAPPRPSRPLPRPQPAPEDLVPAAPPRVFDEEHPEEGTRPLYVGPLPRRPRRRLRLSPLRLLARRRARKGTS